MINKKRIFPIFITLLLLLTTISNASADSTFQQMKDDVARGGWEVLWSESYGIGDAAALTACVYFGCAQSYLGYKLDKLKEKVGKQLIEQALRNKGKVMFGPGKLEIQAGDAYWSVYHKIWSPLKGRHEKVTTERYVRLYVKYRRKSNDGSSDGTAKIQYRAHVASIGWMDWVTDGEIAGTTGKALRMEAIQIVTQGLPSSCKLIYQSHVAQKGWLSWVENGEVSGTVNESRRMEAIKIALKDCPGWHVSYRSHVAQKGWLDWVSDGVISGTTSASRRMEAIQIKLSR